MLITRCGALILLLLGFLPIANWIPGGHEAPWYNTILRDWMSGGAMLVLVGLLAFILLRRSGTSDERQSKWQNLAERIADGGWKSDLILAGVAAIVAMIVARAVFSGRPLLIDEIIQVFQARIFAGGALWTPSPPWPEFTSSTHMLDMDGRRFAQFPPGWSLLLAPFALMKVEWLAGPMVFGLAVLIFARLLRRIEPEPTTRVLAVTLFALSPFAVFLGASHMNHMPTLTLLLLGCLALSRAVDDEPSHKLWWSLCTGLAFGAAATIRPTDAAAFALPAGIWLLWRTIRGKLRVSTLLVSGVGIVIPVLLMLGYNTATTGDPLLFGYTAHWGTSHGLGFHAAPWGDAHTPLRGLELINLYLLRLQFHLFEAPIPALLLVTAGLWSARRLSAIDRWALAGSLVLLVAYFAYWHDGYFLGPRFLLPLTPWLVLWTARIPAALRIHGVSVRLRRTLGIVTAVAIVWTVVVELPFRTAVYSHGLQTMRWDPDPALREVRASGTVLVRESWGAELVARMRALPLPAEQVEWLYRGQDACDLEMAVGRAEQLSGGARDSARKALSELAHHAAPGLVALPEAADTSLRWRPDRELSPVCVDRYLEMQAGFTLFLPLLLARSDVHFIRDLHARDTLVVPPGEEPEWLLIGDPVGGQGPRLIRIDQDSVRAAWGRGSRR